MQTRTLLPAVLVVTVVAVGCGGGDAKPAASQPSSNRSTSATGSPGGGASGAGLFTTPAPWTTNVAGAPSSERSDAIIAALANAGGWGNDDVLQTDFAIPIFFADANTPRMEVVGTDDYCYGGPDCDEVPAEMPVPADAYIEGSEDLSCDAAQEDCHLLVVDRGESKLYELYQANKIGDQMTAGGFFVWDLNKEYPDTLRGPQCTSADAAGFPIAAMTPTADEVASGELSHALRFILPNDRMKEGVYVAPATHAGGPENTDPDAPPYGVRFRLKADFDDSSFSDPQKVVIKAMKTYGMLLSDGGEIALTFADDENSTAKWADLGIDSQSFKELTPDQFEVVDLDPEIELTYECIRNP
ncbi:MAG: hypothetical protein QOF25_5556 [Mycobacterium sp.]|jgi:hypothetical protein|nr:hypothetical protein [Mycobacterium sp.]